MFVYLYLAGAKNSSQKLNPQDNKNLIYGAYIKKKSCYVWYEMKQQQQL